MNRLISTLTIVSTLSLGILYAQKADNENVTRLYIASFDRTPDIEGLNYWVNQSNLELEQISTSFFEQDEMKQKYSATSTNGDFINSVYKNLFNHTPDEDGLRYWEKELDSQNISSSEFILAVVNGAVGDDSTLLDIKTQSALNELNITNSGEECISPEAPILDNYTKTELTTEQKYSLAYMWHEEKLAKEIYLELNKVHPSEQLVNIANNAEVKHIEYVQNLVEWYDINVTNIADYEINYSANELDSMGVGLFALPEIQSLYDMLYDKGITSPQDTLEVGCMVEVTDVNDLDKYIVEAGDNMALVDTFNILRDGSYNHYWSFDKGLKNMGITDGCCSLGIEYCHTEYPQNENGNESSKQEDGQGQQHQYGKRML
jgi:hypothetical protein